MVQANPTYTSDRIPDHTQTAQAQFIWPKQHIRQIAFQIILKQFKHSTAPSIWWQ